MRDGSNLGTARVQVLDEQRVFFTCRPVKQTRLIAQKYWEQGQGLSGRLGLRHRSGFVCGGRRGFTLGMYPEYDFAGHIQKGPVA